MKKDALVAEYNRFFTKKPSKWTGDTRNEFARVEIEKYFGRKPISIIDLGCGNGHTLSYFSRHWKSSRLVGLDLSDVGVRIAKARNLKKVEFITGFVDETIVDRKFELVTLLGVAEHFENPMKTLELIKERFILPLGIMYLEVPNCISYPESKRTEGFRRLACGSHQTEWHLYRETWESMIKSAGFTIEKSIVGPKPQWEFIWILKAGI